MIRNEHLFTRPLRWIAMQFCRAGTGVQALAGMSEAEQNLRKLFGLAPFSHPFTEFEGGTRGGLTYEQAVIIDGKNKNPIRLWHIRTSDEARRSQALEEG